MALFEITAKHQMYLGAGNQINKGERMTMNIHTMGAQPYNIFSNPESRRQAIQQFAVNGVDINSREHLLNAGHWDIKKLPDSSLHKSIDNLETYTAVDTPMKEIFQVDIIDDVEMKKGCIDVVKDFNRSGLDLDFAVRGLEGRCEIVLDFYDSIKEKMGIDADLQFVNMPENSCGGYNPYTNKIELNSSFLEKPDCEELLNTILHESRHAFQNKCVQNPDSVTVKENIIDVWKDNMKNYISPEFDFEAYENQEIEKDANYFADSVMKKGSDYLYA